MKILSLIAAIALIGGAENVDAKGLKNLVQLSSSKLDEATKESVK
jgi:hypothetical protein